MDMQLVEEKAIRIARRKAPPKVIGGYFGTREADLFFRHHYFMEQLDKCGAFIDITAGTGQFPLALIRKGKNVGMIDRCLYISSLFRAWSDPALDVDVERLAHQWVKGYRGNKKPSKVLAPLDGIAAPEVLALIDHIAKKFDDPLTTHCLGRAICKLYTYRGRRLWPTSNDGGKTLDITPEEFLVSMLSQAARIGLVRKGLDLDNVAVWSLHGDSYFGMREIPKKLIKGGMVYQDTAWPYSKKFGKAPNPYEFYWNTIDPIIAGGREMPKVLPSWTNDTPVEDILTVLADTADRAFRLGARSYVLCSQSTNYPDPQEVFKALKKMTGLKLKKVAKVDDYSTNAKTGYENFWAFYEE